MVRLTVMLPISFSSSATPTGNASPSTIFQAEITNVLTMTLPKLGSERKT